ncbi:MAG: hypothetical protein ACXWEY_13035 [Bacteroidia bacterium]
MVPELKNDIHVIEVIANNIAWMYSFKIVDYEDIKAAVRDITLNSKVQDEFVQLVYEKYVNVIKSGNNLS